MAYTVLTVGYCDITVSQPPVRHDDRSIDRGIGGYRPTFPEKRKRKRHGLHI